MTDPFLSHFGHPILPAGFNTATMNGDDVNGPGLNEPVWPQLFDTFVPMEILIITEEMLEVFEGCADYVVPCQNNVIAFPTEMREIVMPKRKRA